VTDNTKATLTEIEVALLKALTIDGAHHKQWYLEKTLHLVCGHEKYMLLKNKLKWNKGIAPKYST
jgi:hypothetical protein